MAKVLIVDDDKSMCFTLERMIRPEGHEVKSVYTLDAGIQETTSGCYDVVFLDVMFPEGNGLDILPRIKRTASDPEVIIMTAVGCVDGAELAIQNGAWDYLQKPISLKELRLHLTRALQFRREVVDKAPKTALKLSGILGQSPGLVRCIQSVAQAAGTDANVLITGETGTGKELFARAIHENSSRSGRPFVVVDCAALPETLVESMLFGHEKGAFTGADKAHQGLVALADRGTLFLDEIGELSPSLQKSFLRVLQERRFRPVGGKEEVRSDFRLIAATNRKLDDMVKAGRFRNDLLFRLRSLVIELPPLRDRKTDITDLALHYTRKVCERYGTGIRGVSPEFLEALLTYPWPGNVRELVHAIEKAVTTAQDGPTLFRIHLPKEVRVHLAKSSFPIVQGAPAVSQEPAERPIRNCTLRDYLQKAEQRYLLEVMTLAGKDIKEACRISGLSRTGLYGRLKRQAQDTPVSH